MADGGEPEPGDVDAAVPVDAVSIQADVDGLLDASCVPMLVLVHALYASWLPMCCPRRNSAKAVEFGTVFGVLPVSGDRIPARCLERL